MSSFSSDPLLIETFPRFTFTEILPPAPQRSEFFTIFPLVAGTNISGQASPTRYAFP
nr:MAG TPA: hypothetical protein [Caudoviricetes sp.]